MKKKYTAKDDYQIVGKYEVDKNFTIKDLNRFNELLVKYFPPEFNIYFIHGTITGFFSVARKPLSPFHLELNGTPLIYSNCDFENETDRTEFKKLFINLNHIFK